MYFKNISILASFFVLSSAFGAPLVCENLDYQFSAINVGTSLTSGTYENRTEEQVTCEDVQKVASVFSELKNIAIGAGLKVVEGEVALNIFNEDDNASFANVEFNMPSKFWYGYIHNRHPDHVKSVWAHEYGHYVFAKNLASVSSSYGALFKDGVRKSELEVKKNKAIMSFIDKHNFNMSEIGDVKNLQQFVIARQDSELNAEYDWLMHKIHRMEQQAEREYYANATEEEQEALYDAQYSGWLFAALHEYFADVMAVVYTERGDCVYESLYNLNAASKSEREYVRYRDFTNNKNKISRIKFDVLDIYTLFAPLRAHLWNNYLSRPMFMKNKEQVLGQVFKAVESGLIEILNGDILDMDQSTFEARVSQAKLLNRVMIYQLDQLLAM